MATTPASAGASAAGDVIDQLAELAPGSRVASARAQRPESVAYAQSTYLALFEPDDPDEISLAERALLALQVALVTPFPAAIAWYRARAEQSGAPATTVTALLQGASLPATQSRLTAMLGHARRLTKAPRLATPADIAALKVAGLSPRSIVTLTQLVALVTYQVRVVAGLRALAANEPHLDQSGAARPAISLPTAPFTMATLRWQPWFETVDDIGATTEQSELVARVAPSPDSRAYYATLAHDTPVLRERTALFNATMYAPGGLRRADRELTTVVASRINGCVYCASVHARRYAQLTRDETTIQRLLDEGLEIQLGALERALVDLAAGLTAQPDQFGPAELTPLRRLGLSDAQILDAIQATAMFANANRLMQTLGEPAPVVPD